MNGKRAHQLRREDPSRPNPGRRHGGTGLAPTRMAPHWSRRQTRHVSGAIAHGHRVFTNIEHELRVATHDGRMTPGEMRKRLKTLAKG